MIRDDDGMDAAVQDYIDAILAERRPLFDRLHRMIVDAHPGVITLTIFAVSIPTSTSSRSNDAPNAR